jgi:hypothetical protein
MSMLLLGAGVNFADIHVKLAFGEDDPEVKQYCACKPNLYWIRHMDAPAQLVSEDQINAAVEKAQEGAQNSSPLRRTR